MSDLSLHQGLLLQSDKILGVTLTCVTGLITILGALVVYCQRFSFLEEPRSIVVALSLATGGTLCFTFLDMLPTAEAEFNNMIQSLLNDTSKTKTRGYASLLSAGTFSVGVIMVWIVDTLCLYFSLPTKMIQIPRDPTIATIRESSMNSPLSNPSRTPSPDMNNVMMSQQHEWLTKELLYKTGIAKVVASTIRSIPVGLVMCIATVQQKTLGILLACATALLNTAVEGIALAGLLTQAHGFRWRAVLWCTLSALALPLGGFLAWAVLLNTDLDTSVTSVFYAMTSGILVGTCLTQILTVCYNYKTNENRIVAQSVLGGIILMAIIRMVLAFLYESD